NRTVDHPRTRCNARRDERPLRRRAKDKRSTRVITARRVLNVPKASNDAGVGAHEQQKWHTGRLRSPHRWPRETLFDGLRTIEKLSQTLVACRQEGGSVHCVRTSPSQAGSRVVPSSEPPAP